jgi:hypothetical protein
MMAEGLLPDFGAALAIVPAGQLLSPLKCRIKLSMIC